MVRLTLILGVVSFFTWIGFTQAQESCDSDAYLETRLLGGEIARVTLDGSSNRVRTEPSTNGEVIFQIPSGHTFSVNYASPVCSEGIVWREITYLDQVGWTAESYLEISPDYFLEPVNLVQTIDSTILLETGASALAFSPDGTQITMSLSDNELLRFDLLNGNEERITLDIELPILDIRYHPDGSGIYATIHSHHINIWNSNHDLVRRIDSPMLITYPTVFTIDDDWNFVANGGCVEADDTNCSLGGIALISLVDENTDIVMLENQHPDYVRDIGIMSQLFITPGGTNVATVIVSVSEQSYASSTLTVRPESSRWENYDARSLPETLNTITTTLTYGVTLLGGCHDYEDEICVEGYFGTTSWMNGGGTWANFDTLPSEILDLEFSPAHLSQQMRVIALTADNMISVIDFAYLAQEIETTIQIFDDILAQDFAISPDGSVLAIANDTQVILHDISIANQSE